jgi:hypothetical protein
VYADGCVLVYVRCRGCRLHVAHADAARAHTQVRSMYTQVRAPPSEVRLIKPTHP